MLIHGRLDLSSPLDTAWELARAWPDAQLMVIDDSGHKGSAAMHAAVYAALDRFAQRWAAKSDDLGDFAVLYAR